MNTPSYRRAGSRARLQPLKPHPMAAKREAAMLLIGARIEDLTPAQLLRWETTGVLCCPHGEDTFVVRSLVTGFSETFSSAGPRMALASSGQETDADVIHWATCSRSCRGQYAMFWMPDDLELEYT